jgi:hypothetical protein
MAVLQSGTATAASLTLDMRGAQSAGNNIYNIPFRATFFARVSTSAGAGISHTSGALTAVFGMRDSAETHVAQIVLYLATAGSSSLASPVLEMQTRQGSTAAAFINSAAANIFNSAVSRTATSLIGYTVEVTHRGTTFAVQDTQDTTDEGRVIGYFGRKVPRIDLNYIPYFALITSTTGTGFTQTAPVYLEVDAVRVEQFSHIANPSPFHSEELVQQSTFCYLAQPLGSAAAGLVTTGAGRLIGYGAGSTGTAGLDLFVAFWDASAANSAVYDFSNNASAAARIVWYQQVQAANSGGGDQFGAMGGAFPSKGIPFYRGLVMGSVSALATAAGNSALNVSAVYQAL